MVKGKVLIPKELSDSMSESLVGVMTVNQQRVQYSQMENGSQEIDVITGEFNPQMVIDETGPFTTITV